MEVIVFDFTLKFGLCKVEVCVLSTYVFICIYHTFLLYVLFQYRIYTLFIPVSATTAAGGHDQLTCTLQVCLYVQCMRVEGMVMSVLLDT